MALGHLPGAPSAMREVRGGAEAWLTAAAARATENGEGLEGTFRSQLGTRPSAKAPCLCLRSSVLTSDSHQEANVEDQIFQSYMQQTMTIS